MFSNFSGRQVRVYEYTSTIAETGPPSIQYRSVCIVLTFDSPLLTLTHPKPPAKQLYSPVRTEKDFLNVGIGV